MQYPFFASGRALYSCDHKYYGCIVVTTSTMEINYRNPLVKKKSFRGNCTLTVYKELKLMKDRSPICFKSNQSKLSLAVQLVPPKEPEVQLRY